MKTKLIVDSGQPVNCSRVDKSVCRALEHFGVFYEVLDLSRQRISHQELDDTHLLILGQEGIGKSLSGEETSVILKAVSQGMGLVVLDGYLEWYPRDFLNNMDIEKGRPGKASGLKIFPGNSILKHPAQQQVILKHMLLSYPVPTPAGWEPVLADEQDNVCGMYRKFGRGRIVFFLLSASLWQDEYLGFASGLDGLFRRSLSWAARKPFIMKSMPPFVVARIDDVSFAGSPVAVCRETVAELKWLDVLNRHGFIPNAGLYVDDIRESDVRILREKYHDGLAEFSPHAFRDPENTNAFPIYMKHNGEEFSEETLKSNFERVDRKFSEWSITASKTLNAHFGEVGLNALPFLKQRGQRYLMNPIRMGKPYSDTAAHKWNVDPYDKPHFCLGVIPEDKDFFNVTSHPGGIEPGSNSDFLWGYTTFWNENASIDVQKAIEKGIFTIARGLESGFFGCLCTHEQRISHVPLKQWEEIARGISDGIKGIPHIFKSYDYISSYAENRTFYRIEKVEFDRKISVWLKGRNGMMQYLYLFLDRDGETEESFLEVPTFEKDVVLNFKLKEFTSR